MKAFITRYALTTGIMTFDGKVEDKMFSTKENYARCFHGKDWHLDLESAKERAEEMRIAKLQSLDKQIKKISALKF